jgi:hypothetical protein
MELDNLPAIQIPCEDIQALKTLVLDLYDKGILVGENYGCSIKFVNCPENIEDILNDPEYFKTKKIKGIVIPKRNLKMIEQNREDLL